MEKEKPPLSISNDNSFATLDAVNPLPAVKGAYRIKPPGQAFKEMEVGRKSLEGSKKRARMAAERNKKMVQEFLLWREQHPKSKMSDSDLAAKIGAKYGIKDRAARGIISKALKNNSGKTGEMPS